MTYEKSLCGFGRFFSVRGFLCFSFNLFFGVFNYYYYYSKTWSLNTRCPVMCRMTQEAWLSHYLFCVSLSGVFLVISTVSYLGVLSFSFCSLPAKRSHLSDLNAHPLSSPSSEFARVPQKSLGLFAYHTVLFTSLVC